MTLRFVIALLWVRLASVILFGAMTTWFAFGNDNWFEDPLPARGIVFLVGALSGLVALASHLLIQSRASSLTEDELVQLRRHGLYED